MPQTFFKAGRLGLVGIDRKKNNATTPHPSLHFTHYVLELLWADQPGDHEHHDHQGDGKGYKNQSLPFRTDYTSKRQNCEYNWKDEDIDPQSHCAVLI